ncbi:MAG: hypothetical protein ACI875_002167, partial [Planctomycetota bacterium]
MSLWNSEKEPDQPPLTPLGLVTALLRLVAMAIVIYGLLIVLVVTR